MRGLFLIFILIQSTMLSSAFGVEKFRKAQAVRPDVEIYGTASFDAKIIHYIKPGDYYYISMATVKKYYFDNHRKKKNNYDRHRSRREKSYSSSSSES